MVDLETDHFFHKMSISSTQNDPVKKIAMLSKEKLCSRAAQLVDNCGLSNFVLKS